LTIPLWAPDKDEAGGPGFSLRLNLAIDAGWTGVEERAPMPSNSGTHAAAKSLTQWAALSPQVR